MRDKIIRIILIAQGYGYHIERSKELRGDKSYYAKSLRSELRLRRKTAGKIADALLAAGVIATDNKDGCKWVSVKDALPRLGEGVLVIYQHSVWNNFVMLDVDRLDEFNGDKYWMRHEHDVTHWMPLPAPPKEE